MNNSSVLLILVSFGTLFHAGTTIKCWICNSRTDPKCNDPFVNESIPLSDCNNDPHKPTTPSLIGVKATMCRKIRQKVENEWRVTRSCAYLGEPGEGTGNEHVCHYQTDSYNVLRETCTCNSKDGCNHGFYISWEYNNHLYNVCHLAISLNEEVYTIIHTTFRLLVFLSYNAFYLPRETKYYNHATVFNLTKIVFD